MQMRFRSGLPEAIQSTGFLMKLVKILAHEPTELSYDKCYDLV
jgi:hypothetical protein